ncbi:DUF2510 domain-containing protein [Mycobacterium asiaticum]|uniref:DUF2510 domain-containing protein n=1 Tax=Mycobacterium asiaticum TaxID=1790 RepID=A0A1A3L0X5_MYCAS|nr:hypothetical protein A5640_02065 [Mycobacterium asiaticum]
MGGADSDPTEYVPPPTVEAPQLAWSQTDGVDQTYPTDLTGSEYPSGPPAGWYPDPGGTYMQRYWDGAQWTEVMSPGRKPMPWWLVAGVILIAVFVVLELFF